MLAFITSLRHPHNSRDYSHVEKLLQRTLNSIGQQTDDDYVVIIVGNTRPTFPLGPKVHFVGVDWAAPTTINSPETGMGPFVWDKGTKLGLGLVAARSLEPDHVMFFDADDFVSRHIAEWVNTHESPGWVVRKGYMYSQRRNTYVPRRRLHKICGTTFILPYESYQVPGHLTVESSQYEIADGFTDEMMDKAIADHRYGVEYWADQGRILRPLPFAGTVYHVETGENHSGSRLLGPGLPWKEMLLDDFGVPSSRSFGKTLWGAFGPAALKPDLRPRRPFFLKPKELMWQRPTEASS